MPVRASLRAPLALSTALDRRRASGDPRHGVSSASVAERRAESARNPLQMTNVMSRVREPMRTEDHRVPVDGGEISVRSYRPASQVGPSAGRLPVHLFMHGGSFWLGSVAEYEPLCRWYAATVGCVVVSVEYRLAPEFRYPTALEDCYAALCWVADHADALEIDVDRLSVGGVSAGGNLAAAVSLLARDRSGPRIVLQVLEIPATDLTMSQPSVEEFAEGYFLTKASLQESYGFYLPDPAMAVEAYASPLLAADLSGLPPAYVLTCECDPLRDEGEAYARRLSEAGSSVDGHRVPGHVHGSLYATRFLPSARRAVESTGAALTNAYLRQH
jgi:acetyl esterase